MDVSGWRLDKTENSSDSDPQPYRQSRSMNYRNLHFCLGVMYISSPPLSSLPLSLSLSFSPPSLSLSLSLSPPSLSLFPPSQTQRRFGAHSVQREILRLAGARQNHQDERTRNDSRGMWEDLASISRSLSIFISRFYMYCTYSWTSQHAMCNYGANDFVLCREVVPISEVK